MREKFKQHWCLRCWGPFPGYRKCAGTNRARQKKAWRRYEEV